VDELVVRIGEQKVVGDPADEGACVDNHEANEVANLANAQLRMCLCHLPGHKNLHHPWHY
jgi:hypothetical protein